MKVHSIVFLNQKLTEGVPVYLSSWTLTSTIILFKYGEIQMDMEDTVKIPISTKMKNDSVICLTKSGNYFVTL